MTRPSEDFLDLLRPTNAERKRKTAPQAESLFDNPTGLDTPEPAQTEDSLIREAKDVPKDEPRTATCSVHPSLPTRPAEPGPLHPSLPTIEDGKLEAPPADTDGRTEWFREVGRNPDIALRCAAHLGVSADELRQGDNGVFGVFVEHQSRNLFLLLPELRAAGARHPRRLKPPSLIRWQVRLLAEAGLVTLPHVDLPLLQETASTHSRRLRDGLALHFAVNRFLGDDGPVVHSWTWAEAWDGIPPKYMGDALAEVRRHGIVIGEKRAQFGGRKPTWLLIPGTGLHVLTGGKPLRDPERFIPFAGVDPITGEIAT